jgi:phosphoribosylformimino-5-aminoimidazole carboxamide ribonucleotide (ProFAR) isomerase
VPFSLLPAIDLTGGRLGLYTADGPVPVDAFGGDPLAAARSFADAGAGWLHVVDMDLAFTGSSVNLDTIRSIAAVPGVRVQAGGGVRTNAEVEALRSAGAARVVLSSASLGDEAGVSGTLAAAPPGAVIVGIEVAEGRIRSRGSTAVDLDLMATLGWLRGVGVAAFLLTAVTRVASEAGPDLELIRRVARTGVPTMAAGGIASVEDLRAAREAGAVGAVVGRAALDGALDLSAALAWARA